MWQRWRSRKSCAIPFTVGSDGLDDERNRPALTRMKLTKGMQGVNERLHSIRPRELPSILDRWGQLVKIHSPLMLIL